MGFKNKNIRNSAMGDDMTDTASNGQPAPSAGMTRKQFLRLSAGLAVTAGVTPMVSGCGARGRNLKFSNLDQVLEEMARLEVANDLQLQQPWSMYKILNHLAQSAEYSMTGYPKMDPPVVRTFARLAFNMFRSRGFMSHSLSAPVPGAPEIPEEGSVADGYQRLRNAISDFRAFTGVLFPHFSYGPLTREEWEIAHSMHCADHFSSMTYTTAA